MREYEHEASDVASQDVGCAWLMVGVVLSAMLLLPVVLETGATLTLPFEVRRTRFQPPTIAPTWILGSSRPR